MDEQPKRIEDMTADELRAELENALQREWDLARKVESLLMGRARWEREVAAAIQRRVHEQNAARADFYAKHEIRERTGALDAVLHQIEQLGDRVNAKQIAALKDSARTARYRISWAKDAQADTAPLDAADAEIARLRDVIVEQGRALHKQMSDRLLDCRCAGCELIRAMDMNAPAAVEAVDSAAKATA